MLHTHRTEARSMLLGEKSEIGKCLYGMISIQFKKNVCMMYVSMYLHSLDS